MCIYIYIYICIHICVCVCVLSASVPFGHVLPCQCNSDRPLLYAYIVVCII